MYNDMRSRCGELKKNCDALEKSNDEKDQIIEQLKAQLKKPCVMKMTNEDPFVTKPRKNAKGEPESHGCEISGCGNINVDLTKCGMCGNHVCEECSGVKVSKLRAAMNACNTLYFVCPTCDLLIRDTSDVNVYDTMKEKVDILAEELASYERENSKLKGDREKHQNETKQLRAKITGLEKDVQKVDAAGNDDGKNIDAILSKKLEKIENSIEQIISKKLEESLKGVSAIGEKIDNAITTNKKTFAQAVDDNVTDTLTTAFRNRKNQEIVNQAEREKRSANLIIYGINEPNVETQKEDDESFVSTLLEKIGVAQRPKNIHRLGQRAEGKTRPVKLVLASENEKDTIMARLGNLKNADDPYRKVSIREDYTIEEREMVRDMVKQAAEKNDAENTREWKVRGTPKTGLRLVRITTRQ